MTGRPDPPGTRIVLRPIGNPLPLGFLALAVATLLLAGLQLGWLAPADAPDVGLILLAFAFPLQLSASVFGFLARDVAAGTGMGVLAGSWLAIGLIRLTGEPGVPNDALGLFLVAAGAAVVVPAATASLGKLVPALVLVTTAGRFALTGVAELTGAAGWETAAGVVGLALCALAFYAATAMALEDGRRRTVLPLGRHGAGAAALDGGLAAQLDRVEHEAGVRTHL